MKINRNFKSIAAACALTVVGAAEVHAKDIIDATDPEAILNLAKGYGSAKLGTDSSGDPKITGRIDGTKYGVYFYGCKDGKNCDDIQFAAAWSGVSVSLEEINEWNRNKRFGRAYLDSDGDPSLLMSVNIDYGVTEENLDDTFNWWKRVLEQYREEVLGM
jgi:hypothetical protein